MIDPQHATLDSEVAAPETTRPVVWWRRRISPKFVLAVVVLCALPVLNAMFITPSPYAAFKPGPTFPVAMTDTAPDRSFEPGRWRLLTVAAEQLTWAEVVWYAVNDREYLVLVDDPAAAARERAEMASSREVAAGLANAIVHREQAPEPLGALVIDVGDDSGAQRAGVVPGDVITAADGSAVTGSEQLQRIGGDSVKLEILRDGEQHTLEVSRADGRLGVFVVTVYRKAVAATQPQVPDNVAGASGGLIFTLATIDALEPGDLSGGRQIAGTGGIDATGKVLRIEGLDEKISAAAAAGAQIVFAPAGQTYATPPDGVTVVSVSSVYDALVWLCSQGTGDVCDATT